MAHLSLRKSLRFRVYNRARYAWDRALAGRGSTAVTRVLIASDDRAFTSEQQFAPFRIYRRSLRDLAGVVVNHRWLDDVLADAPAAIAGHDVVLAKLGFQTSAADAERTVAALAAAKGSARLIYCDGDDDAAVQWPSVLPSVDLYLKSQAFADASWYERTFVGKNNLTDYVARTHGLRFDDDPRPTSGPVAADQVGKIVQGWNLGLGDATIRLHRASRPPVAGQDRGHDVTCRSAVPKGWTSYLRQPVMDRIASLSGRCRVLASAQRVAPPQYYAEMRDSTICVSPFGFGEVCWRDFEAVLCGCLLVKPDMGHLRTEPNVYLPGETYVPVRWDYADLEETCLRYLADRAARERIVARAYQVLNEYLARERFVDRVRALLRC